MPPTAGGEWLLEWLFTAGPVQSDGMGLRGLSWQELQAWRDLTATWITPWEARALHQLSAAYAGAWHASQEPAQEPYWLSPELVVAENARRVQRGDAVVSMFSGLARKEAANGG